MRRRVLGVALAAVVLVAGYWFLPRAGPQAVQEERSESPRVSTSGRVTALGRLAPRDEVISVSAPDGDRLLRLEVREGQAVETGAILAYLESHAERRAEAQRIEHQLAESVARLDAETTYGQAVIVESEARIRQVETVSALEIQAQEARVQQLMAEWAQGGVDLERAEALWSQALIARQELDQRSLAAHRHEMELRAARVHLEKLQQERELSLRMARAQLSTAQAGLTRAQRAIELDSLREAFRLAQVRLERSVIRAPIRGEILKVLRRPGEETGKRPILEMGDLAQMYAVAEVYETELGRVRVGQTATVTSPALTRALRGTVETVGRSIARNLVVDANPAAAVDRRVAEVKIRLDDSAIARTLVHLQVYVDVAVGDP